MTVDTLKKKHSSQLIYASYKMPRSYSA